MQNLKIVALLLLAYFWLVEEEELLIIIATLATAEASAGAVAKADQHFSLTILKLTTFYLTTMEGL